MSAKYRMWRIFKVALRIISNSCNDIILIVASPVGMFLSRLPILKKFNEVITIAALIVVMLPMLALLTTIGKAPLALMMVTLVLLMVAVGASTIFFSYMSRTFEFYGCSATLSGLFNCMSALGIVLANYVFTRFAESYGWVNTTRAWLILTFASLLLTLITIPLWNRFLKRLKKDIERKKTQES